MHRSLAPTVAAALVALAAPAASAHTIMSGLWSPGAPSHYQRGLESAKALRDADTEQRKKGRRLIDIEIYQNDDGKRRWAGLWVSGDGGRALEIGVDKTKLNDLIAQHDGEGLVLVDIETYEDGGKRKWAAAWRAGTTDQKHDVDVDDAKLDEAIAAKNDAGFRVIDLDPYKDGDKRKWLLVWSAGTYKNPVVRGMTLDQFRDKAEKKNADGLRLVDIERYRENGEDRWAAVWRGGQSGSEWVSVDRYPELFTEADDFFEGQGLMLADLEVYDRDCGDAFALPFEDKGTWRIENGNWDDHAGHGGLETGLQAFAWDFVNDTTGDGKGDEGGKVLAARGGTVVDLQKNETGNTGTAWDNYNYASGKPYPSVGNFVVVDHGDGTYGTYWHLQAGSVAVKRGDKVVTGQKLGKVGQTGHAFGAHVHFDVRTDWSLDYPQKYPDSFVEYPSVEVRMHDKNHKCWRPTTADALHSDNEVP